MTDEEIFFTTVKNPKQFRRGLLESSKEIITVLKDYQMLQKMRQDKKEKVNELRQQFDELHSMMQELDAFLPEESLQKLHELMPHEEEPEPEPEEDEGQEEPEEGEGQEGHDEGEGEHEEGDEEEHHEEEHHEDEEPEEEEDPEIKALENTLSSIEEKLNHI